MMIAVSQTTHQVDLVDDMDSLMAEHQDDSQYRQALQENWEHDYDEAVSEDWRRTSAIARAKADEAHRPALLAIQAVLETMTSPVTGYTYEVGLRDGGLIVDGVNTRYELHWETTYAHQSRWSSRPAKPIGERIVVGQYGDRQSYPMRKDGTYSWGKIAERLGRYADGKNRATLAAIHKQRNQAAVERVKASHGLREYSGVVSASSNPKAPVTVSVKINLSMTEERAERLLLALRRLGIDPSNY